MSLPNARGPAIWHARVMDGIDMSDFPCPRCGQTVAEDYYGPCHSCRSELRSIMGGEAKAVVASKYEPKMNVTPNAVALKD